MKRTQKFYVAAAVGKTFGAVKLRGILIKYINDPSTIVSVTSGKYRVSITLSCGSVITAIMPLGEIMLQLDPAIFYLCNHSSIVNGNFVDKKRRYKRGLQLIMKIGQDIYVSVLETKAFNKFIKPFLANR